MPTHDTEKIAVSVTAFFTKRPGNSPSAFWFEVERLDIEEVVHTDGMFRTRAEAIEAGREWAAESGYSVEESPDDPPRP